mgnify:CR=1 FL=1
MTLYIEVKACMPIGPHIYKKITLCYLLLLIRSLMAIENASYTQSIRDEYGNSHILSVMVSDEFVTHAICIIFFVAHYLITTFF